MKITLEGISHKALAGVTALVNSNDNDLNKVLDELDLARESSNKKRPMMNLAELDIHSTGDSGTTFKVTIEIDEEVTTRNNVPIPVLRKYLDMLLDSLQIFPKRLCPISMERMGLKQKEEE